MKSFFPKELNRDCWWFTKQGTLFVFDFDGTIENKKSSLAVHYRPATSGLSARWQIHKVFDGLPRGARRKGDALSWLAQVMEAPRVIYLGDDATDEDAYRASLGCPFLSVRVGHYRKSSAKYFLKPQRQIDEFISFFTRESKTNYHGADSNL